MGKPRGLVPVSATIPRIPSRLSDEQDERADRLAAEWARKEACLAEDRKQRAIADAADRLWRDWGKRYERATFENFTLRPAVSGGVIDERGSVVVQLRLYGANIRTHVRDGMGVVLTGPPGTGKDHLLAALAKEAINVGLILKWTSGNRLFRQFRDDIAANRGEEGRVCAHTKPDVLILSDPAWDRQVLTRYQREKLGDVVDARTNNLRPTWVSINADNRRQADELLGSALVDRLTDGALSLPCNWASYRKSVSQVGRDEGA